MYCLFLLSLNLRTCKRQFRWHLRHQWPFDKIWSEQMNNEVPSEWLLICLFIWYLSTQQNAQTEQAKARTIGRNWRGGKISIRTFVIYKITFYVFFIRSWNLHWRVKYSEMMYKAAGEGKLTFWSHGKMRTGHL